MMHSTALDGRAYLDTLRGSPRGARRGARRIAMESRRRYENELRCIELPSQAHL